MWGNKVHSCMDKANIRLMVLTIKKTIEEFLHCFKYEQEDKYTAQVLKQRICDYLDGFVRNKCIRGESVDAYPVLMTWKRLYPSIWKRSLAKFGKYLSDKLGWIKLTSNKMSVLHFVFPFKRYMYVDYHMDKLKKDWYDKTHDITHDITGEYDEFYEEFEIYWNDSEIERDRDTYVRWYHDWLKDNPPVPVYLAKLVTPYKYLAVDCYIQPRHVLEYIHLNFTINKNRGITYEDR